MRPVLVADNDDLFNRIVGNHGLEAALRDGFILSLRKTEDIKGYQNYANKRVYPVGTNTRSATGRLLVVVVILHFDFSILHPAEAWGEMMYFNYNKHIKKRFVCLGSSKAQ